MDDEGWEARMSERAKHRAVIREAEEIARRDAEFQPVDFEEPVPAPGRFERIATEGDDVQVLWLGWKRDEWS